VQISTVAQFDTLNLTAAITPLAYSVTNKYGGIIAFKCKTAYNYSGSAAINTVAKGIPIANVAYRPATTQEGTAAQIGWENHITSRKMYMNCPDGIVFIAAKASNGSGTASRFGGTTAGVARSASQIGGPTIMWLSETMTGFDPSVIAKTSSNTSGKGLARCYIATESKLPADEYLYALDCLSNPARLTNMGIKNFGSGMLGDVSNPTGQVNSYAAVSAISGQQVTISTASVGFCGGFDVNAYVMIHVSAKKTTGDNAQFGKFYIAQILAVNGSVLTLDIASPFTISLSDYYVQAITIPNFKNLTISSAYSNALAWDDTKKYGGICALATSETFDLSNGQVLMSSKGLPVSTARPAITTQCSGTQGDYLPISQGSGAVFILSNVLTLSSSSRIGNSGSGANYAAAGLVGSCSTSGPGRIIAGGVGGDGTRSQGGSPASVAGASGGPGTYKNIDASTSSTISGGSAGVSIFIVADTINNFSVSVLATGGKTGNPNSGETTSGAGYGAQGGRGDYWNNDSGAGDIAGSAGGSTGTCFVYCNNLVNIDYTAFQAS
jgi:hypothetical protein